MIGTPTVTIVPDPADPGTVLDITCLLDAVAIRHGRDDATAQPDAATATLDLSLDTSSGTLPAGIDVGSIVTVVVTVAGVAYTRFVGKLTDYTLGWEDYGPDTPNAAVAQLIAVSALADLGSRVIGGEPWPQEDDGARVARILTMAGVVGAIVDPGTVEVLARDVDAQDALDLAQEVAVSAGGLLWHTRAGTIAYADAQHRRGTTPALELDACDVLVTPTWKRDIQGLVNGVVVTYGTAPEGGERPTHAATRTDSRDRYGPRDVSLTTVLAALADAEALAQLLMTRNAFPVWLLRTLPVDVAGVSEAATAALLGMEVGDLVSVTGMPAAGGVPTTASLWVEGWEETLTPGDHALTLSVSGYCRTVPPPRWNDVPTGWTWDTLPVEMTWDAATCIGPIPSEGRWDDVPASLRWDQVPATTTWDTWPSN